MTDRRHGGGGGIPRGAGHPEAGESPEAAPGPTMARRALDGLGPKGLEALWRGGDGKVRRLFGDETVDRMQFPDGSAVLRRPPEGRGEPTWAEAIHSGHLASRKALKHASSMEETDEEGFLIVPIDGVLATPGSPESWAPWMPVPGPEWAVPPEGEAEPSGRAG